MIKEIVTAWYFLKTNWYNKSGLIMGLFFVLIIYKYLLSNLFALPTQFQFMPYVLLSIFILIGWLYSRNYYPKTSKSKVGILIAIHTENERDETQIKNDFIYQMKRIVLSHFSNRIFQLLALNNYLSGKIENQKDARRISQKSRAYFCIWGIFKKRQHHGQITCVLGLQSLVRHKPIKNIKVKNQFSKEFNQIFPTKIQFSEQEELLGFELTVDIIQEAVVYLCGIAALISGDIFLSLKLHDNLLANIQKEKLPEKIKGLRLIKDRLPKLLAQEYSLVAQFYYVSKKNRDLQKVKEYSQKSIKKNPNNYSPHLLLAICYFFEKKNIQLALREVLKTKKIAPRDGAMRYSEAFLYFYDGHFPKGELAYKKALKTNTPPSTILEVETFITDIIEQEPDKAYFYYPLGLINYIIKQDYILAEEYFQKFVSEYENNPNLKEQIRKARVYLKELTHNIKG